MATHIIDGSIWPLQFYRPQGMAGSSRLARLLLIDPTGTTKWADRVTSYGPPELDGRCSMNHLSGASHPAIRWRPTKGTYRKLGATAAMCFRRTQHEPRDRWQTVRS
jgi:hypothetical protein